MKVLVIPSWYPTPDNPLAGVFIEEHVKALEAQADVAVLYIRQAQARLPLQVEVEGGTPHARIDLEVASARNPVTRIKTRAQILGSILAGYRKAGTAAYEALLHQWGRPDIVHVHSIFPGGLIAREIKRRYGIPYVVTEHSNRFLECDNTGPENRPGMLPLILRPVTRDSARMIAVSRYLAEQLERVGLAEDPVVIPNVVRPGSPSPVRGAGRHVITHVSNMAPAKNLGLLIEAIAALGRHRDDFMVRLIGDGICRPDAEILAARLGVTDVVDFLGYRPASELPSLLTDSTFTVVSSLFETFSVVAAESLSWGRPVLSTRCGGPEEFITPDVGRLVDNSNVDALAVGLDWMLSHYSDFDPLSLSAYAKRLFSPSVVTKQVMEVYASVLSDSC